MATTKTAAKKSPAKKAAKKTTKKSINKFGPAAAKRVETEMHKLKKGTLKSGSGQKVTNPKQAIAIALSEARKKGARVPKNPNT